MDIKNKSVLVLGAWGLVGNAVTHKLIPESPKKIIITSLKKEEAEDVGKAAANAAKHAVEKALDKKEEKRYRRS